MPIVLETLSLQDAKRMLAAGEAKAEQIGIPYNIAVVDAGGNLLAFSRQDGALISSIDLAIHKAFTARACDMSTGDLAELAQPGKPLYGIQCSNGGKIVIFGGGLPIRRKGIVIGAIGASAGTVEQDIAVAEAAAEAFEPSMQSAAVGA
ncbi:MAG TPA: heme-binding protein [Chthoniobacterales bacterium]|nr:heme-binding protein [Chthoniobacterales bacterium]